MKLTLFVTVGICVWVAGCSNKTAGSVSVPAPVPHTGKLTQIEYINPLPSSAGWNLIGKCMRQEAAKDGIGLRTVGAAGGNVNVQAMTTLLSQAVADRVPAIAMWSGQGGAAFDQLFAKARSQGALVATLGSYGATRNQNISVSTAPSDAARALVRAIASRRGHQYVGMILQSPTGSVYDDQFAAMIKRDAVGYRNVRIVAIQHNLGKFTDNLPLAEAMMTAHPELTAMFTYGGSSGMPAAIVEMRRVGKVFGYWNPGDSPALAVTYAKQGVVGGLGYYDRCTMGRLAVQKLRDAWAGKPVLANYFMPFGFISGGQYERVIAAGLL
jgi:hypothetical protein